MQRGARIELIVGAVIIFLLGTIVGLEVCEHNHIIHPEYAALWKQQALESKVDLLTCEAEKVEAVISERIRLTGKPNP